MSSTVHHNSFPQNLPSRSDSGDNNVNSRRESPKPSAASLIAVETVQGDTPQNSPSVSGVVEAILEIGRQRGTLLVQLRAALESGQEKEALILARRLCGLSL